MNFKTSKRTLSYRGNGVLPINDKPILLRQMVYVSSSSCRFCIREQLGDEAQQVIDRLAGRKEKQIFRVIDVAAGDRQTTYEPRGLVLKEPCEIEVEFDKERATGFFEILLEMNDYE